MKATRMKRAVLGAATCALGLTLAGCLGWPEREDHGHAVRHMQSVQTATPGTRATPVDAGLGREIMKNYRKDVAKPTEIKNEITINVGN